MMKERFWSKVKRTPGKCWEWQANKNNKGYGLFRPGGTAPKQLAHRVSYEMTHGWIPKGKIVRHTCDNPACVNPDHLLIGTQLLNVHDAIDRKRHVNPPNIYENEEWREKHRLSVRRGGSVPNATLTEPKVREIWRLHLSGKNISEICATVQCTKDAAYDLCRGRTWRHLPGAPSVDDLKNGGVSRGHNQFSNGGDTRGLHPGTKIPSSEIPAILARRRGGETLAAIGADYGVLKSAIWRIVKTHS